MKLYFGDENKHASIHRSEIALSLGHFLKFCLLFLVVASGINQDIERGRESFFNSASLQNTEF